MDTVVEQAKEQLQKEAEAEKVNNERKTAFGFGMKVALSEAGLTPEEFAKKAGLEDPSQLTEASIAWLSTQLEAANQQPAQAQADGSQQ